MSVLTRFRDWWLGQLQAQRGLGKVVWAGAPLLLVVAFACCGLTVLSVLVAAPSVEATAVAEERIQATVERAAATQEPTEPTAAPATSTELPVRAPATATGDAGGGVAVVAPAQVATQVTEATREVTSAPSATVRPATATPAPSATPAPPTRLPATSTSAPATATRPAATATTALPTAVPPTAVPPTAVPPTPVPPTAPPPTAPPVPTATLPTAAGVLRIVGVDKGAEVVTIRNDGGAPVDLAGWVLRSERGSQDCGLGGAIGPGQTLQIWAMAEDAGRGGFNCGFGSNIWNNSESDPAVLIDPSGAEVSRW